MVNEADKRFYADVLAELLVGSAEDENAYYAAESGAESSFSEPIHVTLNGDAWTVTMWHL